MGTANYRHYAMRTKAMHNNVFENGATKKNQFFIIVFLCDSEIDDLYISVCNYRKSGKASNRNKMKRITKEILDELVLHLVPCLLAVIPKPKILLSNHLTRKKELLRLLENNNLLSSPANLIL